MSDGQDGAIRKFRTNSGLQKRRVSKSTSSIILLEPFEAQFTLENTLVQMLHSTQNVCEHENGKVEAQDL